MQKPKIKITIVEQLASHPCHRGQKVGDTFDFDEDRGKLCPMALHTMYPYIDILRYGGEFDGKRSIDVCCPDRDTIMVFHIEAVED